MESIIDMKPNILTAEEMAAAIAKAGSEKELLILGYAQGASAMLAAFNGTQRPA